MNCENKLGDVVPTLFDRFATSHVGRFYVN